MNEYDLPTGVDDETVRLTSWPLDDDSLALRLKLFDSITEPTSLPPEEASSQANYLVPAQARALGVLLTMWANQHAEGCGGES